MSASFQFDVETRLSAPYLKHLLTRELYPTKGDLCDPRHGNRVVLSTSTPNRNQPRRPALARLWVAMALRQLAGKTCGTRWNSRGIIAEILSGIAAQRENMMQILPVGG
jgi:hypothetical protein